MSLVFAVQPRVTPKKSDFIVKEVRAFVLDKAVEEAAGGGADCHSQSHGHWIVDTPIANPCSLFEEYKASRTSWGVDSLGSVVVEVDMVTVTLFSMTCILAKF
jgi:L-rhamnonate dehydratase